jgi:hypothetical protein
MKGLKHSRAQNKRADRSNPAYASALTHAALQAGMPTTCTPQPSGNAVYTADVRFCGSSPKFIALDIKNQTIDFQPPASGHLTGRFVPESKSSVNLAAGDALAALPMGLGQSQIGVAFAICLAKSLLRTHTRGANQRDTQALCRHLGCWKVAVHNFGCVVFVVKVAHKSPNGPFVVANCSVVVVEVQKHHYWVHCKVQSHHIVRGL